MSSTDHLPETPTDTHPRLLASLTMDSDGMLHGFVVDPECLTLRFAIDVVADGYPIALLRAQDYVADLESGDGCYGFTLHLSHDVRVRTRRFEIRLSNTGHLAAAMACADAGVPISGFRGRIGQVRWSSGLKLTGWLPGDRDSPMPHVKALIEGQRVAATACRGWTQVAEGGAFRIARSFEMVLPREFADGRVHSVDVFTEDGDELAGSPCSVFALADGFESVIDGYAQLESERIRARLADGLLPQSVPFLDFPSWSARFAIAPPDVLSDCRVAILIVGQQGLEATLSSLDTQRQICWSVAVLPAAASPVSFDPEHLRTFLTEDAADCELIIATVSGTQFRPDALAHLAAAARRFPQACALYGDIVVDEEGRGRPVGFPAFDEELFLEQGYCGLCFAVRPRDVVPERTSLFALFPDVDPSGGEQSRSPVHVPLVLSSVPYWSPASLREALAEATTARLARRNISAAVSSRNAAHALSMRVYRRPALRTVSVLIAVNNNGDDLRRTIDALARTAGDPAIDVVLADNDSSDPSTLSLLSTFAGQGGTVLRHRGWFNEPHLLNLAAAAARGDELLFLRAGLVSAEASWRDELLSRSSEDDVGAVGALVAWPGGIVREAGYVLGPRLSVSRAFTDCHLDDEGYAGWLATAHQVSAVSAACMMVSRHRFVSLGGFDAVRFSTTYHDVDLCLRLRAAGCRIVFTPDARFSQSGANEVRVEDTQLAAVRVREIQTLRDRWQLAPGFDPFYSPWIAMDGAPYAGLAWPPASVVPRQPSLQKSRT